MRVLVPSARAGAIAVAIGLALLPGCYESHARLDEAGVRDPSGGRIGCEPGARVRIGCAAGCGIGSCTGDPVLAACDGTVSITQCRDLVGVLEQVDDTACGGLCPELTVTCPSVGSITVAHRPFGGAGTYTCDWQAR